MQTSVKAWDSQSGHLEDGAVHLVHLRVLVQQAVGAAAQAAVQRGRRHGGFTRPVAGAGYGVHNNTVSADNVREGDSDARRTDRS